MDLKKFEYQKAEYVKAFKIVGYANTLSRISQNYLLLNSGMPNLPFAVAIPNSHNKGWMDDMMGKYFVMHEDGDYEILDTVTFELLYHPRT